jgi:desulfoferrodoxin-like iron-binding protein
LKKQVIACKNRFNRGSSGGERMTNVDELYVCKICGNAVKVVMAGAGVLVCCGQPMELVEEEAE